MTFGHRRPDTGPKPPPTWLRDLVDVLFVAVLLLTLALVSAQ